MATSAEIIAAVQEGHIQQTYDAISQLNITGLFSNLKAIRSNLIQEESVLAKMADAQFRATTGMKIEKMESRKNLFAAYETLQQIRFKITGQELNYRLYITGPDNTARGLEIGAANLEQFVSFHGKAIDIAVGKVRAELDKEASTFQRYDMTMWYKDAMGYMRKPSGMKSTFFIQTDNNEWTYRKNKQGEKMIVTYNRGHIIEAVDKIMVSKSVDDIDKGLPFNDKIFYKYLKGDSVSGFKGGDTHSEAANGAIVQTQLKANAARLMRYSSIVNALNSVIAIGDQLEGLRSGGSRSEVAAAIKNMYSDDSGKISAISDDMIDKFIDKFLDENLKIFSSG